MSADNYFLVRRHPQGGFTPLMGFASVQGLVVEPERHTRVFATPEEALEDVLDEYAEYGHGIHPECFRPPLAPYDPATAASSDWEILLERCTDALTMTMNILLGLTDVAGVNLGTLPFYLEWDGDLVRVSSVDEEGVWVVVHSYETGVGEHVMLVAHDVLSSPVGVRRWAAQMIAEAVTR